MADLLRAHPARYSGSGTLSVIRALNGSVAEQDSFAEHVEDGATEHLALDQLKSYVESDPGMILYSWVTTDFGGRLSGAVALVE
ncbi:hypothetical protein, partial [Nocardia nova]|uniref:hypothetical protein n=1 Tax=Nocardia nova TaxID=37330 RepID=UPI0025B179E1